MPPVVERRGSEHGDAAPGRNKRAQRPAESPDAHGRLPQEGIAPEGGGKDEVPARNARQHAAQMNREVGRRPERVAPDGTVPRDIPMYADHSRGYGGYGAPHVPRHRGSRNGNRNRSRSGQLLNY